MSDSNTPADEHKKPEATMPDAETPKATEASDGKPKAVVDDETKKHGDAAKKAAETSSNVDKTAASPVVAKPEKPSFTPTRANHEKAVAHAAPSASGGEKHPPKAASETQKGGGLANKAADLFEDSVKYTAQGIGYLGGGILKGTGWVLKKSYNGVAAVVGGGYSLTKRFFRGIGKGFKNAWHDLENLTWKNLTK